MVRSFTALITVLLLATMMYAQNAPQAPSGYRGELTRGTMFTGFHWTPGVGDFGSQLAAEVPTYNGETGLGVTNLYGIEYGYFISTGWAVGGVLDFGTNSSTADVAAGIQDKNSGTEFGITAFINRYFEPSFEDVSVWVGAGISFGSLSNTHEVTGTGGSKDELSATSFGIGLDFGAQYFIGKGFSLTADYKLGFISYGQPESTHTEGGTSTTVKGPSASFIGTMSGSMGIQFYF